MIGGSIQDSSSTRQGTGFIMLVQFFYALAPRLPKQRLPKWSSPRFGIAPAGVETASFPVVAADRIAIRRRCRCRQMGLRRILLEALDLACAKEKLGARAFLFCRRRL
jgi:hypothetical protein